MDLKEEMITKIMVLKSKLINKKEIIQILCNLATILTMIAAVIALYQNVVSRNSLYKPLVKAVTAEDQNTIALLWNYEEVRVISFSNDVEIKLINIGNGNANNVTVTFDENVLETWINELEKLNEEKDYDYLLETELTSSYFYISTGEENAVSLKIPNVYVECLAEICMYQDVLDIEVPELPVIKFKITYEDIQGKEMSYAYVYGSFIQQPMARTSNYGEAEALYIFSVGKETQVLGGFMDGIIFDNFINICNTNAGLIAFIQTIATVFLSVAAVIVAIRAARKPYKKKLSFNTGLNYDQDGNYTLDVYLVNTGHMSVLVSFIKVEYREMMWYLDADGEDESHFILPQKSFHGRFDLTGLNANDESLKRDNIRITAMDSVGKEFCHEIGWAVG